MSNWTEQDIKTAVQEFLKKEGLATHFPHNDMNVVLLMLRKGNEVYPVEGANFAHVTFHCKTHSVSVDAAVPYTSHNYALANQLNLETAHGAWQFNPSDGMVIFSYYIPTVSGIVDEDLLRDGLRTTLEKLNHFITHHT